MPILAMSAGTVTAVWGNAYIRLPGGGVKAVQVGDKVAGGERIFTDDNGLVEISPNKGASVLLKTVPPDDVDQTLSALDRPDPTDAPAAGLTGGAEGGLQPGLRVERVDEHVSPTTFDLRLEDPGAGADTSASSVDQRALPATFEAAVSPSGPAPELPGLRINTVEVNEAAGEAVFTVTLSQASTLPVTVHFATQDGSAHAGSDFSAVSGTLTFAPGEVSKTITVPVLNDLDAPVYEGTETFTVQLSEPTNAVIAVPTGAGTIRDDGAGSVPGEGLPDDDRPYMLVLYGEPAIEGQPIVFNLVLTHPSTTDVTVSLALQPGANPAESAVPGLDTGTTLSYLSEDGQWLALTGNLTFKAGVTQLQVRVDTIDDHVTEVTEFIRLQATVVSGDVANPRPSDGSPITTANETAILDNDGDANTHPVYSAHLDISSTLADPIKGAAGGTVDVFAWHLDGHVLTSANALPVVDTVKGFDLAPRLSGGDVLDLRDLLQGENTVGGAGNLDHYLHIDTSGPNTLIKVAQNGDFTAGPAAESQRIVLESVNLRTGLGLDSAASDAQVITRLLDQGKLLVDHA